MVKFCKGIAGEAGLNESGFESDFDHGFESDCGFDTGKKDSEDEEEEGGLMSNVFFTNDVKKAFEKYGIPENNSKWVKRFALGQPVKKALINPLLYAQLKKTDCTYYKKEDYYQVKEDDDK